MKVKILVLLLIGIALAAGTVTISSRSQKEQLLELEKSNDRGKIQWRVQVAKAKGLQKYVYPSPTPLLAMTRSLDDALSQYTVIIARPVAKKTYVYNSEDIITWFKFAVSDNLSQPGSKTLRQGSITTLPAGNAVIEAARELLPLSENEILIPQHGGTLEVDGVTLTQQPYNSPEFSLFKRYLLFVSRDESEGTGNIKLGPHGVFSVNDDNQIEPVTDRPDPLKRDLEMLYTNSIYNLKTEINRRSNLQ